MAATSFGKAFNLFGTVGSRVTFKNTSGFVWLSFTVELFAPHEVSFEATTGNGIWSPILFKNLDTMVDESTATTSAQYTGSIATFTEIRFTTTVRGKTPASIIGQGFDTPQPVEVGNFPATQAVSGPLTNPELRADTVATQGVLFSVQSTGLYNGRAAKCFNIIGRRQGFTNTTVPHDLKEYDAAAVFYPALTGVEPLEIVSSSANDTAAGTGIRSVKVTYIDAAGNMVQSAAISLNGTTPVAAGFTALEILWMESASAGSLRIAQGNIRLRVVAGPVEVEQITLNSSKSKTGKFMIPVGYTGYLVNWATQAINNDQDMFCLVQCDSLTRALTSAYHIQDNLYTPLNTTSPDKSLLSLKIPALARVKLSSISGGTAATVRASGSFSVLIIED